ncbi:hypothetical protein Taro_014501 [Colocasia esculenta]|uniref:Uncharacterized protein n=1 Tax=Colocasia esculenta TaxID=4460 RepID=A0A843UJ94_COLES|nr:hypothetical protein [Colocasia esculenta]
MLTRASRRTVSLLSSRTNPIATHARPPFSRASLPFPPTSRSRRPLSSASPYPLYYELISYRPPRRPPRHHLRSRDGTSSTSLQSQQAGGGGVEGGGEVEGDQTAPAALDRSKRKYYRKRTKRMYGESDSEGDGGSRGQPEFVELEPEVVDFPRLHAREKELYFYDAFSFPWEKEKHYRMVYQLEKKYFPDQCLDKAFVDPRPEPVPEKKAEEEKKRGGRQSGGRSRDGEKRDERSLIFFDDQGELQADKERTAAGNISETKVEEFFKCLKKVPSAASDSSRAVAANGEPFLVSRKTGLPPKWDGPSGTVVLVDKPKGQLSYSCISTFYGVRQKLANLSELAISARVST